ncbi:MAG: radical SAM protein [Deltaproteobacteria bacterium]|nr:radical SAM protein [Deltaproteobacteria bacterium]
MSPTATHIFGPVPSRRLGLSLGIDLVPFKTCTLDCIYCELGQTATPVTERAEYVARQDLEEEIAGYFARAGRSADEKAAKLDYITLSGSGEPTLNTALPHVIALLRQKTQTPIALLTNGTLFTDPQVRREAAAADVILPSLDAVSPACFARVNRPASGLDIKKIIAGLVALRQEYRGQIWLEILFCNGLNDTPREISLLQEAAAAIKPDKIQLNTVVRPGALPEARTVSPDFLKEILPAFGPQAEIIAPFARDRDPASDPTQTVENILATLKRRPCTKKDIEEALGLKTVEVIKTIELLLAQGRIKSLEHGGEHYFQTTK